MADVRPFRGILYNPEKIEHIAKVVTEPYDVVSVTQQAAYYKSSPYNIIRLILGKCYPRDNSKNNQYTRASQYFADWLKRDILLRDKKDSIYIYAQNFSHNNRMKTRTGFIVLLKLEDFAKNTVLPHENTFSQLVQDRLRLLHSTNANLSPIFALFCDPQRKINRLLNQYKRAHLPYLAIKKDNTGHKIWRMSDKRKIMAIQRLLRNLPIFIADGHHRYEAALNYKIQMQRTKKDTRSSAPFDYVMTYLAATSNQGLTILPIHRVIKMEGGFKVPEIVLQMKKMFRLYEFSSSEELSSYMHKSRERHIFGAYFGKNRFCGLKLKNSKILQKLIDKDRLKVRRDLDVTILHSLIIESILNLTFPEQNIYYTRDAQEGIKLVDQGKYHVAFFLRPTTVTQVKRMAATGEKMPHKSTYFYPKLLSGLVINKL